MSLGRLFTARLAQRIEEDQIEALKVLVRNPN
jgi:hypothetical protein